MLTRQLILVATLSTASGCTLILDGGAGGDGTDTEPPIPDRGDALPGELDDSFAFDGKDLEVLYDLSVYDGRTFVLVEDDDDDIELLAVLDDGSLDDDFGSNGAVSLSWNARAIYVGDSGITVTGEDDGRLAIERYDLDGQPDPSLSPGYADDAPASVGTDIMEVQVGKDAISVRVLYVLASTGDQLEVHRFSYSGLQGRGVAVEGTGASRLGHVDDSIVMTTTTTSGALLYSMDTGLSTVTPYPLAAGMLEAVTTTRDGQLALAVTEPSPATNLLGVGSIAQQSFTSIMTPSLPGSAFDLALDELDRTLAVGSGCGGECGFVFRSGSDSSQADPTFLPFELHASSGSAVLEKVAVDQQGRIVVGGIDDGEVTLLRLWN